MGYKGGLELCHCQDNTGATPLHYAALKKDKAVLAIVMKQQVSSLSGVFVQNTGVPTLQGYLYEYRGAHFSGIFVFEYMGGVHFAGEWIKSGHPCIPYKYPLKTCILYKSGHPYSRIHC